MRKVILFLSCLILINGCVSLRGKTGNNINVQAVAENGTRYDKIVGQNICGKGFFIESAEIEINGNDISEKLLASLKFRNEDSILISLKGKSGIEAARVFISRDSIFVNDRINKKLLLAKDQYLIDKFCLSVSVLPVIFGDFISSENQTILNFDCLNENSIVKTSYKGIRIIYIIDCRLNKVITAVLEDNYDKEAVSIKLTKFLEHGNVFIPGRIEIFDNLRNIGMTIVIKKISYPWEGDVEFIPGNRYEKVQIL